MRKLLAVLVALAACTSTAPGTSPTPPATSPATPSPPMSSPPPSDRAPKPPAFSAARVLDDVKLLAGFGPREAASRSYRRAARAVAERFRTLGYEVRIQTFPVPGGAIEGAPVRAGRSRNVIAEPAGLTRATPRVVIGAHLDTVPPSPGANDNASGVAVMMELARLAAAAPPEIATVFVAFGAEERRRQSPSRSAYAIGARTYLDELTRRERAAVRGGLVLDMIGNGPRVLVLGKGSMRARALGAARALAVPAAPRSTQLFSDHVAFMDGGISVAWLWSGEHPSVHTPSDVPSVVRAGAVRRAGRVAWETLRRTPL